MPRITPKRLLLFASGFGVALLLVAVLRFATYNPPHTHYHANFALYVNGQRDEFKSFTYYEEIQSCSSQDASNPKVGAHMHDNINDVVHVHRPSVTWGQFFANLGYTLGNDVLKTDKQLLVSGPDGQLSFVLNGQETTNVANRVIQSQDRLLVNYGSDSAVTLMKRYNSVANTAGDYNRRKDPASCSGAEAVTFSSRFRYALGLPASQTAAHSH